jgi:hypothetical protein
MLKPTIVAASTQTMTAILDLDIYRRSGRVSFFSKTALRYQL